MKIEVEWSYENSSFTDVWMVGKVFIDGAESCTDEVFAFHMEEDHSFGPEYGWWVRVRGEIVEQGKVKSLSVAKGFAESALARVVKAAFARTEAARVEAGAV